MARPRIIPGESVQASFSLSTVEYELMKAEAKKAGDSFSQWIRLTLLEQIERAQNG